MSPVMPHRVVSVDAIAGERFDAGVGDHAAGRP